MPYFRDPADQDPTGYKLHTTFSFRHEARVFDCITTLAQSVRLYKSYLLRTPLLSGRRESCKFVRWQMSSGRDQMHVLGESDEAVSAGFERGDQCRHHGRGCRQLVESKDMGVDTVLFASLDLR